MKTSIKFTKELKNKWIEALESGNYIQAKGLLYNPEETKPTKDSYANRKGYCCIGVLAMIAEVTTEKFGENVPSLDIYSVLASNIGCTLNCRLTSLNDSTYDFNKPDYSNVIPFIKTLPTTEN